MIPHLRILGLDVALGTTLHGFGDTRGDRLDPLRDSISHGLTIGTDRALHECFVWEDIGSGPGCELAEGEYKVLPTANIA